MFVTEVLHFRLCPEITFPLIPSAVESEQGEKDTCVVPAWQIFYTKLVPAYTSKAF